MKKAAALDKITVMTTDAGERVSHDARARQGPGRKGAQNNKSKAQGHAVSRERSRIIVCDDQTDMTLTLSMLLRAYGYEVFSCFDGPACVQKARVWHPYAAIIDIGLAAGITGYDVAKDLRALPGGEDIILIAMTARGKDADVDDARLAGFNWHFKKPAPATSVLSALRYPDLTTNFGTRLA